MAQQPSPLCACGIPGDLLLTSRIYGRGGVSLPKVGYKKSVASVLLDPFLLSEGSQLPCGDPLSEEDLMSEN